MLISPSDLFGKPGYLPLAEYVADIERMRKNGPWRLPFGAGDRLQFFFLKILARFSWFADILYVLHESDISPAYAVLSSYAQKKKIFDSLAEGNPRCRGYFAYYLKKTLSAKDPVRVFSGRGVAQDRATAFSIALGEIIERMVSGFYDRNKDTLCVAPDELMKKYPVLYPPRHHRFLDVQKEQFAELRHDPMQSITWVGGRNLITQEKTFIPRWMTSWFVHGSSGEKTLVSATTNGAAGYFTKAGAVLRGLLEIVQRDAFLVHWLTMIPPQVIRRETLPEEMRKKIQEFESVGISLSVLNITALPIPSVCIAAMSRQAAVPRIVVSAASAVTFEEAIRDAMKEMTIGAEAFYLENDALQPEHEDMPFEPFVARLGQFARQLYWRGAEKVSQFQWFIAGESVSYDDVCKQDIHCERNDSHRLAKCLGILKRLGSDYYPIVYWPQNRIQKELGFYIAQVFVPKAFPLYLNEYQGTFDSDRLREFALAKGVSDWKLNTLPHMFT